jgi:uncharacterized protein (DUF885 family)
MTDESTFYASADRWLSRLLELNPVAATQLGEHRWDDRLGDLSAAAMETEYQELLQAQAEFEAMDIGGFSVDAQVDHQLTTQIFDRFVRDYEKERSYQRNPGVYLDEALSGVFLLIMLEFAPLGERLHSALGRVREVPRVLAEGRDNVVVEEVPPVWAQTALEQAQQAPGLFMGLLPALAAQAAPEIEAGLTEAGQAAAAAIEAYTTFLQDEVLPQAKGDFAAGRALFDEKLREEHMVDYDADELLATGWEQFRKTRAQMEALSREIDPEKSVRELMEAAKAEHPTAEGLLDAYRQEMSAIRGYVLQQEIASIPAGETLRVVETPVYLRPIIPYAAYMPPGILEAKQEGIFLVTPVDPDAPPEEQEQKLKGHYWAKLPITALHEAYPGHHLQLVWGNQHDSIPRRLGNLSATLFIEGWAFYCEELLEQMGYIAQPIQRLGRLSDQLWRAARIILDVSLHTKGMPVDEAIDFLVEECRLEPANARAEVWRYTQSPTQPQCYLMGKLAILEIVDDYRRAHPHASMREMHDAILACGSLPPRLMRKQLAL